MELKVFRDVLPAAGADCTAKAELPLETELLISDYLPPVQRIVKCFAKPVVLQKQLAPGRLTLEGYLRCTVYYQGEEGAGLCQTEQKLPFTKALELPSFAATAWTACVEGQTEYLNCRAVNPRRIEVRGAYGLVVSVHAQLSTEVITALSEGGIEQKPVTLAGVRRAATLEKLVTIEGALTFPKPPAAILDITGTAEVRELKRMQGKAVAKGVLHVLCGWRAEGDAALRSQTADLPFNQILDADGLSEDCRCLCVLEPVGFAAAEGETTEDGAASTTLTATAMLRLSGWRPYQLQCVADAFSTRFETTLTPQTLATESLLCALDETTVLRGSGPLPDAGAHILACFASFGPVSLIRDGRQEGRAVLTARAVVSAFAENTLGEMECYEKALDYALPLPADLPPDTDAYPECWLSVQDLQCAGAGGALDVSLTVRAEGAVLARQTASLVGAVELGDPLAPADPEVSLRICYAQPGEELFAIARRYHVSPGQMLAANDLPDTTARLDEARRLLVPGGGGGGGKVISLTVCYVFQYRPVLECPPYRFPVSPPAETVMTTVQFPFHQRGPSPQFMDSQGFQHKLRGKEIILYVFIHVITKLALSDYVPAEYQHPFVRLNARIIRVSMLQIIQHLRCHFGRRSLYLPPHLRCKPLDIILVP